MPDIELYTNFDDFDTFELFKKDIRKEIIEEGLDTPMSLSARDLVSELKFIVNQKITINKPENITGDNRSTQAVNDLNQPVINIPKSESELIKFLTNGKADPSKYNKSKDYTTLSESNIVYGQTSRGSAASNRVTLRMEIDSQETVSSQYEKAKKFFQEALFGLPDEAGNTKYYVNPGIDIAQYVKIKCSVFTGDGDIPGKKGLSPKERFERASKKGYADWTIKQEAVDVIRKNFIDLSGVLGLLKEGDYDRASEMINIVDKNQKLEGVREQISKLKAGVGLPATTKSYTNAINLINNIKVVKKVEQEQVLYTLVSNFTDFPDDQMDFFEAIQKQIRSWGVDHEDYWFNSLVKRAEKLISKYESKE